MLSRTRLLSAQSNFCRFLSTVTNANPQPQLSVIEPPKDVINPEKSPDYFQVHNIFTIKDMFNARIHYGHKEGSLNPKMKPFLFGTRLGHTIFDLDITAFHLREALNFLAHIAYNDGIILLISRNPEFTLEVEKTAKEIKEFAYTRQWRFGLFTNSVRTYKRETRLPDVCVFLNTLEETNEEHFGVAEAAKVNIPSIGIVDSNCDPNLVCYPVPGSDDSTESLKFYLKVFKEAILRGKNERLKHMGISSEQNNEVKKSEPGEND